MKAEVILVSCVLNSEMDTDNCGVNSTEEGSTVVSSEAQTAPMSFSLQLNTLKREREIGAHNWAILEKLASEPSLRVDQRNINLIPAINNQRRANSSLDNTVKKIVRVKRPMCQIPIASSENGVQSVCRPESEVESNPSVRYINVNVVDEVRTTVG